MAFNKVLLFSLILIFLTSYSFALDQNFVQVFDANKTFTNGDNIYFNVQNDGNFNPGVEIYMSETPGTYEKYIGRITDLSTLLNGGAGGCYDTNFLGTPKTCWYNLKDYGTDAGNIYGYTNNGYVGNKNVYQSYDRTNWNTIINNTTADIRDIKTSEDGEWFIAPIYGDKIMLAHPNTAYLTYIGDVNNWTSINANADLGLIIAGSTTGAYLSKDYGTTFNKIFSGNIRSTAISQNGQYITLALDNNTLRVSTDYGITFTSKESSRNWIDLEMSYSGQYQVASVFDGYLYVSDDYGSTWNERGKETSYQMTANKKWYSIGMSADGQYIGGVMNNNNCYYSLNCSGVLESKDYGQNFANRVGSDTIGHYGYDTSYDGQTSLGIGYVNVGGYFGQSLIHKNYGQGSYAGFQRINNNVWFITDISMQKGYKPFIDKRYYIDIKLLDNKGNTITTDAGSSYYDMNTGNCGDLNLDPVPICSLQDLKLIDSYPTKNYVLKDNINLDGYAWEPIYDLLGSLDGNNFGIYNFNTLGNTENYFSFINKLDGNIININFIDVNLSDYADSVICGEQGYQSIIKNVYVSGQMNFYDSYGTTYSGVISNSQKGLIENAYIDFNIIDHQGLLNTTEGGSDVGLVSADCLGTLKNIHAKGNILGFDSTIGGICGIYYGSNYEIQDGNGIYQSSFEGNLFGTSEIGGLIGYSNSRQEYPISQSYAKANITCNNLCGGLIGDARNLSLKDSYFNGDINTSIHSQESYGDYWGIGGLVGELFHSDNTLNNVYASGKLISGDNNDAGGKDIGGLVGDYYSYTDNSLTINNSFSLFNIQKTISDIGGIIGSAPTYSYSGTLISNNNYYNTNNSNNYCVAEPQNNANCIKTNDLNQYKGINSIAFSEMNFNDNIWLALQNDLPELAFDFTISKVLIFRPKDEITRLDIDGNWNIDIGGDYFAQIHDLNQDYYELTLISDRDKTYIIDIGMSDENSLYHARRYTLYAPYNFQDTNVQPYLLKIADGYPITIKTFNALNNVVLPQIRLKVYKNIGDPTIKLVEDVITDDKGEAIVFMAVGGKYLIDTYYDSTIFIKRFDVTANAGIIYMYLVIPTDIPNYSQSGYVVNFLQPLNAEYKKNSGDLNIQAQVKNFGLVNTGYFLTIKNNGSMISSDYTSANVYLTNTLNKTLHWADLNAGTLEIYVDVVKPDGNQITFKKIINLTDSFGINYSPIWGLTNGLRQDFACDESGICWPLFIPAIFIAIGLVLYAGMLLGNLNMQASGLIFFITMVLFGFLNWVPIVLVVALGLIISAFIINERRS